MDFGGMLPTFALQQLEFSGLICAIVIGSLILSILIAIWVYRDAESRGMSGVLWLIVILVGGLIGLLIYLIVRSDHPVRPPGYYPPPGYPPYGAYYPPAYPGYPPPQAPPPVQPPPAAPQAGPSVTCKSCGATSPVGAKFCRQCGATF